MDGRGHGRGRVRALELFPRASAEGVRVELEPVDAAPLGVHRLGMVLSPEAVLVVDDVEIAALPVAVQAIDRSAERDRAVPGVDRDRRYRRVLAAERRLERDRLAAGWGGVGDRSQISSQRRGHPVPGDRPHGGRAPAMVTDGVRRRVDRRPDALGIPRTAAFLEEPLEREVREVAERPRLCLERPVVRRPETQDVALEVLVCALAPRVERARRPRRGDDILPERGHERRIKRAVRALRGRPARGGRAGEEQGPRALHLLERHDRLRVPAVTPGGDLGGAGRRWSRSPAAVALALHLEAGEEGRGVLVLDGPRQDDGLGGRTDPLEEEQVALERFLGAGPERAPPEGLVEKPALGIPQHRRARSVARHGALHEPHHPLPAERQSAGVPHREDLDAASRTAERNARLAEGLDERSTMDSPAPGRPGPRA